MTVAASIWTRFCKPRTIRIKLQNSTRQKASAAKLQNSEEMPFFELCTKESIMGKIPSFIYLYAKTLHTSKFCKIPRKCVDFFYLCGKACIILGQNSQNFFSQCKNTAQFKTLQTSTEMTCKIFFRIAWAERVVVLGFPFLVSHSEKRIQVQFQAWHLNLTPWQLPFANGQF